MTQLLISVKNEVEAKLAIECGADVIDLKDPNVGALGALDLTLTAQIVRVVDGRAVVSATVGERHASLEVLLEAISRRVLLNVDIVKIAVESLPSSPEALSALVRQAANTRLMAVLFADKATDWSVLPKLADAGFYGAMLDTQAKNQNLLNFCTARQLIEFVYSCQKLNLQTALAGSLKPQHIEQLAKINPTYLGFRGAVCENAIRNGALSKTALVVARRMLHKHNIFCGIPRKNLLIELHS